MKYLKLATTILSFAIIMLLIFARKDGTPINWMAIGGVCVVFLAQLSIMLKHLIDPLERAIAHLEKLDNK